MPDFQPNEYLFETHADKAKDRWEIYAWAVRDAMVKAGNFSACELSLKDKFKYESYMQMKPGAQEPAALSNDTLEGKLLLGQSPVTSPKDLPNNQAEYKLVEHTDRE